MSGPDIPDDPARVGPPEDEHWTDPMDVPDSEWEWKDCPTAKDFEGLWDSGEGEV
jgi:hypothetical protein